MIRDFITLVTIARVITNWLSIIFIKGRIVNIDCFIILSSRVFEPFSTKYDMFGKVLTSMGIFFLYAIFLN